VGVVVVAVFAMARAQAPRVVRRAQLPERQQMLSPASLRSKPGDDESTDTDTDTDNDGNGERKKA
jgi:hypothetical protein